DWLPAAWSPPGRFRGAAWVDLSVGLDVGLLAPGIGALIGPRLGLSVMLGAAACFLVVAPALDASEVASGGPQAIFEWSRWAGAGMLLAGSAVGLAPQLRRLPSPLQALRRWRGATSRQPATLRTWFRAGILPLSAATVVVGQVAFAIPWPLGVL